MEAAVQAEIEAATQTIDVQAQSSAVEETQTEDNPSPASATAETEAATQTIDVEAELSE